VPPPITLTGFVLAIGSLTCCSAAPEVEAASSSALASDGSAAAEPPPPRQSPASGTGGDLIPITSGNVARAGHDAHTAVMIVQFRDDSIYEYYDVPPGLWDRFLAAQPDPWSRVGYPEVVQGEYAYMKISS